MHTASQPTASAVLAKRESGILCITTQPLPLSVSMNGSGLDPAVSTMRTFSSRIAWTKPLIGPSGLVSGRRERFTQKGLSVRRLVSWMSAWNSSGSS